MPSVRQRGCYEFLRSMLVCENADLPASLLLLALERSHVVDPYFEYFVQGKLCSGGEATQAFPVHQPAQNPLRRNSGFCPALLLVFIDSTETSDFKRNPCQALYE